MGITALRRYRRTLAARAAERAAAAAEAEAETFEDLTDEQLEAHAVERGIEIPDEGGRAALVARIQEVEAARARVAPQGQEDADPNGDDVQHVADPAELDEHDPSTPSGDQEPGKPDEATEDRIESDLGEQARRVEDAEDEGREPESVHEQVREADPADEGREVVAEPAEGEQGEDGVAVDVNGVEHVGTLPSEEDGRPAGNASTETWREYATADPSFTEDPSELGRDEIRAIYAAR